MAARMAMMAMTTRSSISVNAPIRWVGVFISYPAGWFGSERDGAMPDTNLFWMDGKLAHLVSRRKAFSVSDCDSSGGIINFVRNPNSFRTPKVNPWLQV